MKAKDLVFKQINKLYEKGYFITGVYQAVTCSASEGDMIHLNIELKKSWMKPILTPILDKKEKEYLEAVLKPFRDYVKHIVKSWSGNEQTIEVEIVKKGKRDKLVFPGFKKGTMYKGMQVNRGYTPEELGLF